MAHDEQLKVVDLLLIRRRPHGAHDRCAARGEHDAQTAVCVFASPQALAAFPVGTSLVVSITRAVRTIVRTETDSPLVPLAAAAFVGLAIFGLSMTVAGARPRTVAGWAIAAGIAALDSLVLFAAALGIEKF